MESLFRLMLVRPASTPEPESSGVDLTQDSQLQKAIIESAGADDAKAQARAAALRFARSNRFLPGPAANPLADTLGELQAALDALADADVVGHDELVTAVEDAFGQAPDAVVASAAYNRALERVRDSIVAIKYARDLHRSDLEGLAQQARLMALVSRVAGDDVFPADADQLQRFVRQPLRLPTPASYRSVLASKEIDDARKDYVDKYRTEWKARLDDRFDRFTKLKGALGEVTRFKAADLLTTPSRKSGPVKAPQGFSRTELEARDLDYSASLARGVTAQVEAGAKAALEGVALARPEVGAAAMFEAVGAARPTARVEKPGFTPTPLTQAGFYPNRQAIDRLSDTTAAVLAEQGIDLTTVPLDEACGMLSVASAALADELDAITSLATQTTYKRVGSSVVAIAQTSHAGWSSYQYGLNFDDLVDFVLPDQRIPTTRGDVEPSGVADLLVIKQQLTGYEGADVAHIENVLRGESSVREHVRRRVTEEFTFIETEETVSEERELESTSRFEMSREVSETIKEEASLKAGLSVSGKYGPVVEFSASAEGSLSRTKEAATKSASEFSQDVTERSATKVTQRTLERASLKVTNEVTETNTHSLDNSTGAGHVSGVYQWVTKVYQAQMYNYGLRTMFDFMVPEPAAALIFALAEAPPAADLVKPQEFTLTPSQISEYNYGTWVNKYAATDVEPPPDIYTTVATDYSAGGGGTDTSYNHSAQLSVPGGYRAVHGSVGLTVNAWDVNNWSVDVVLGQRSDKMDGGSPSIWQSSLSDERGAVPFALNTYNVSDIAVAVEVKCQRTDHALDQWRADTHAKLTTAYRARLAEYEEQLAALEIAAGVEIEGRHPDINLQLMRDELKKHCISTFTDQHYDLFGAIVEGAGGEFPHVDVDEAAAEGSYVRFFEQAFEWEHMTWVTYPYFWGRRSQWASKISFEDTDPLFNQFLKAGFARVSVPVRPGFEGAVDHFLNFGELWEGGPLPTVSSDLFLPIATEIAEQLDRPGDEVAQGDPWTVKVPTTLVKLRTDDLLPTWFQNDDGEWVEGPAPATP